MKKKLCHCRFTLLYFKYFVVVGGCKTDIHVYHYCSEDIYKYYKENLIFYFRTLSLSEFKKIWTEQTPHILIMKPATDLCSKCQRYVFNIKNAGNLSEEEKRSLLDDKAKGQREFYRDKCIESKALFRRYNLDQIEQGKYLTNIFGLMDGWMDG